MGVGVRVGGEGGRGREGGGEGGRGGEEGVAGGGGGRGGGGRGVRQVGVGGSRWELGAVDLPVPAQTGGGGYITIR